MCSCACVRTHFRHKPARSRQQDDSTMPCHTRLFKIRPERVRPVKVMPAKGQARDAFTVGLASGAWMVGYGWMVGPSEGGLWTVGGWTVDVARTEDEDEDVDGTDVDSRITSPRGCSGAGAGSWSSTEGLGLGLFV